MKQMTDKRHARMVRVMALLTAAALAAPAGGGEAFAHSPQPSQQSQHRAPADHRHMPGHGHTCHWLAPQEAAARGNPAPATAESVREGEALFRENCVACHGVGRDGNGPLAGSLGTPPADLNQMASMHPDGDLAWKIANGRGDMPAWKDALSETDIWNLVNYLKRAALPAVAHDSHEHAGNRHEMAEASTPPAGPDCLGGDPSGQ